MLWCLTLNLITNDTLDVLLIFVTVYLVCAWFLLTQSDDMSLISDSLGRFRNVLVFTHFAAFSPMNDTQRSTNDLAPFPPANVSLIHIRNNIIR